MTSRSRSFERLLEESRSDIFRFSKEILRFQPTDQQGELFELVQWETFAPRQKRKRAICVKSGQGPGKTAASTVVAQFRLIQSPLSFVLVTSPTRRQVEDIWIAELTRQAAQAPFEYQALLDIQGKRARFAGFAKWEIATATGVRPENVQGYHQHRMTVLVDEASGIARKIYATLKGTCTQPDNLMISIGNPNDRNTEFFDMFNKDKQLYHCLTWNAEKSPNVDPRHIARMAEEYGRDSDTYRVRVLGEFPLEAPNVIIRYEDLLYACRETTFGQCFGIIALADGGTRRQMGIDLARFGSDESVIVARYNSAVAKMIKFSKREPIDVLRAAMDLQRELGWSDPDTIYCVDANGMGQGALAVLYENGKKVFEFNAQSGTAADNTRFTDAMSEAYWNLRTLSRERLIHLPEDAMMFQQLVTRQYYFRDNKIQVEDKDEYMTRIGQEEYTSPDRADAVALAFYPPASGSVRFGRRSA